MTLYAVLAFGAAAIGFLIWFSARRFRAGRNVERLKTTERANAILAKQNEAAARRPRDADDLRKRMRSGDF